jgi:dihydrofolate reductase
MEGATVVHGLDEALALAAGEERVFVLGGGEIYRQALPLADRLELTIVHAQVEGDTTFPEIDPTRWRLVADEHHSADERHAHAFSFRTYARRRS